MNLAEKRRLARIVIPGLLAGGLCGLGIGLKLVSLPVGLAVSVLVAAGVGLAVRRQRAASGARPHDD